MWCSAEWDRLTCRRIVIGAENLESFELGGGGGGVMVGTDYLSLLYGFSFPFLSSPACP